MTKNNLLAALSKVVAEDQPDNLEDLDYLRKIRNKGLKGKYPYDVQLRLCKSIGTNLDNNLKKLDALKKFLDTEAPDVDKIKLISKIDNLISKSQDHIESIKLELGALK